MKLLVLKLIYKINNHFIKTLNIYLIILWLELGIQNKELITLIKIAEKYFL